MKSSENQFVKLPTRPSSETSDLSPEEEFMYIGLRSFLNGTTYICNPSYKTLADRLKLKDSKTIAKYLKSLQDKGYIQIIKAENGKRNSYKFIKDLPNFEKFKPEFIESSDLTFQQKSFLTAVQRLQFKDEETGLGNVSYQELEIANKINQSGSLVNKRLKELSNMGIVKVSDTSTRDNQTGLIKKLYSFDLSKYNPILKVLVNHEVRLDSVEERLARLERENWELRNKLENQNNN